MKFILKQNTNNQWDWQCIGNNYSDVIATSHRQGYENREDCQAQVLNLQANASGATVELHWNSGKVEEIKLFNGVVKPLKTKTELIRHAEQYSDDKNIQSKILGALMEYNDFLKGVDPFDLGKQ